MYDGFGLNSGLTITGGNGALLVNGEAFAWRPWEATGSMELVNKKGQFDLPKEAFGIFDLLWPRPGMFQRSFLGKPFCWRGLFRYHRHGQPRPHGGGNTPKIHPEPSHSNGPLCLDLLVIGVGKHNLPLSPETKKHIAELGMRVEVLDTRNAAAQFNLLATERGVSEVAAALIPIGWKEGVGAEA